MRYLLSVFLTFALANGARMPANASTTEASVGAFLAQSAYDWNHGDLEAFMSGYEDSPLTEYVTSKTVVRGYANIRAHYADHYRGDMGRLSFSGLSVRTLGDDYAVVVAHWHLLLKDGAHPTGLFSLVLHRSATGWKIVTDHSP